MPKIGDMVQFFDERGVAHDALLTCIHGNDGIETTPDTCVNLVMVAKDESKTDPNGRQIERRSSVVYRTHQSAHGMFWQEI
jgi:hypothetical protein